MENLFNSFKEIQNCINEKSLKVCIWGAGYLGREWGFDYLKSKGIEVDYYCDSNENLWNTEINGRKVISFENLVQMSEAVFVFVLVGHFTVMEVMEQLDKLKLSNRISYSELLKMNDIKMDYFPYMESPKIAVYTCITGDYDYYEEPEQVSSAWDYFLITDKPDEYKGEVTCLDIRDIVPERLQDYTRQNRYCKINAHRIFPHYKYSVYYDANTIIKKDFTYLVENLPKTRTAVASELFIDCIYEEAMRLINARRDEPEIIHKQMHSYWIEGMPEHFGQYWNYVLLREHNNPLCVRLMESWWCEMEKFSKRDQLSLPYIIWKYGFTFEDVEIIDRHGEFWTRRSRHKHGDFRA